MRASTNCSQLVGLPGSQDKYPAQLSGGQQQRIALARALATSPGLLLLDEPLSALDAIVRVHLRQEIRSLQRQLGVTTIMVTHDQEEALAVADRIVVMNHGVIEQVGTPLEVYRDPGTPFVADFVGRINVLPARLAEGSRVLFADTPFHCPHDGAPGSDVKIYLRPEDVLARPIAAGRQQRLRGADREDRVPGLVLPGAGQCRGAGRAPAHRVPVAELPGRAAAGGRRAAAAAPAARAHAHLLVTGARRMTSATLPAPARIALRVHWTDRLAHVALLVVALVLLAFLAAPLGRSC